MEVERGVGIGKTLLLLGWLGIVSIEGVGAAELPGAPFCEEELLPRVEALECQDTFLSYRRFLHTERQRFVLCCFRYAAERGNLEAMYELGLAYELATELGFRDGQGDETSTAWFDLCAEKGHIGCMVKAAEYYGLEGEATAESVARARQLLEQAAASEDAQVMNHIGRMLFNFPARDDQIKGERLLKAAADRGDIDAKEALAILAMAKGNRNKKLEGYETLEKLYEKHGLPVAGTWVGVTLYRGDVVARDRKRALEILFELFHNCETVSAARNRSFERIVREALQILQEACESEEVVSDPEPGQ